MSAYPVHPRHSSRRSGQVGISSPCPTPRAPTPQNVLSGRVRGPSRFNRHQNSRRYSIQVPTPSPPEPLPTSFPAPLRTRLPFKHPHLPATIQYPDTHFEKKKHRHDSKARLIPSIFQSRRRSAMMDKRDAVPAVWNTHLRRRGVEAVRHDRSIDAIDRVLVCRLQNHPRALLFTFVFADAISYTSPWYHNAPPFYSRTCDEKYAKWLGANDAVFSPRPYRVMFACEWDGIGLCTLTYVAACLID